MKGFAIGILILLLCVPVFFIHMPPVACTQVDPIEPDNSFSEAHNFAVATFLQSQSLSLNPAGDYDYIRFYASPGTYNFYTTGTTDTYGYLYSPSQNLLASDDDSAGNEQFTITNTITTSGYYYLLVKGFAPTTTGPYTLYGIYTPIQTDPYEPDYSFSQCSSFSVYTYLQSQTRSLNPAGDYDYIRFYASPGTYNFYTTGTTDTYGYLYSPSQNLLASDDDSAGNQQFTITNTITTSGYYYLLVKGFAPTTTGPYTLYGIYTPIQTDPYEPDYSFSQCSSFSVYTYLQSQTRSLNPAGDYDYIRFYASPGTYNFYTTGTTDTYGYLYSPSQNLLASDDDSAGNQQFTITNTITTSGYYYLLVKGFAPTTTGPYTLYGIYTPIQTDPYEPDYSFSQCSSFSVYTYLQSQTRSLNPAGDYDYIRFYASPGTYNFYTTGTTDTYGYLYDSAQNLLASDDDSAGNQQFTITYTITASDYYYIVVEGFTPTTTGPYTLYGIYTPSTDPSQPIIDSYEFDNRFSQPSSFAVTTYLQSQTRSLNPAGDLDCIRFYASPGTYNFYTTGTTDTYGYLYDPYLNLWASDDDSAGNQQFIITNTITTSGYYYLLVKGFAPTTTGPYTLYGIYTPI